MNKLMEIFLKFLKLMNDNGKNFNKVKTELVRQGYNMIEIDTALEWYFGEFHGMSEKDGKAPAPVGQPARGSVRHFTLEEERHLSDEARSYIMEMIHIESVSLDELEELMTFLKEYMIEDASVEVVHELMIGFKSLDWMRGEGAEDNVDLKIRYLQ